MEKNLAAGLSVGAELRAFLDGIGGQRVDAATTACWLELQRRQSLVAALGETTHEFVASWERMHGAAGSEALRR